MRLDPGQRQRRRELRGLLPVNKDDVMAIEAIAARGYPVVEPILGELLRWTRSHYWPVAKPARDFLGSLGPRLAPQIEEVLGSGDDSLIAAVLRDFVSTWQADDVRALAPRLLMVATHGTLCGVDLLALRLLARHRLGNPEEIAALLAMKRAHDEQRLTEAAAILDILDGQAAEGVAGTPEV
jgi:hypothetical protein